MNSVFFIIFLLSTIIITIANPNIFLSSMLSASKNALNLTFTLCISYTIWLGLLQIMKDCGLMANLSKLLKPINRRLFKTNDREALEYISGNISANFLGFGGVATPLGIKAVERFDKLENREYLQGIFLIINSTSLQLIPSTIMALRNEFGSTASYDVILPILISTAISTIIGVLILKGYYKIKKCG